MFERFKNHIGHHNIYTTSKLYLAISGGVDSMVLSQLLNSLNIKHTLLHCNFNLRGVESNADEHFIKDYASNNNLELNIKSFDTKQEALNLRLNTQECARKLRYDWFSEFLVEKNTILLTAHHLDDSIETFFINILRGTGLKGIGGINSGKNNIHRPLLIFNKVEILNYAKTNDIKFREDSSNNSDNYLRNKLRHHSIPQLKNLTESFDLKMVTLFDELKATNNYLDSQLADTIKRLHNTHKINLEKLKLIPLFLWPKLFKDFGLTRKQNSAFIKFTNSLTGSVFKTKSHIFLLNRDHLLLNCNEFREFKTQYINKDTTSINLNNTTFKISQITNNSIEFKPNIAYIDLLNIDFPLTIRKWRQGDKIQPLGMAGKKLISDILINKKINLFDKNSQLVIESNGTIIWLVDLVISNAISIKKSTTQILKIEHIKY